MADEPKRPASKDDADPSTEGATPQGKWARWRRRLRWQWIVGLLVAPILLHGVGLTYCHLYAQPDTQKPTAEVPLGAYHFVADTPSNGRVGAARFDLHIALLDDVTASARARLRDCEHRVRQNVEQLLRQAHGGDFEDPALEGLKRQLQEQINETLDMRAISEVIITNLELTLRDAPATVPGQEMAEAATPAESPRG